MDKDGKVVSQDSYVFTSSSTVTLVFFVDKIRSYQIFYFRDLKKRKNMTWPSTTKKKTACKKKKTSSSTVLTHIIYSSGYNYLAWSIFGNLRHPSLWVVDDHSPFEEVGNPKLGDFIHHGLISYDIIMVS